MRINSKKLKILWFLVTTTLAVVVSGDRESRWFDMHKPNSICVYRGCNCTTKTYTVVVKCVFGDYQDVEIKEGMIPDESSSVDLSNGRSLRILTNAFTKVSKLTRVRITKNHNIVANRQSFHNVTAINSVLEINECNRVILESHTFKNTKGPMSVTLSRCRYVTIRAHAFSLLKEIIINEVPNLELSSNSFKFDTPQQNGPATKIMFQSVNIQELPSGVFPSTAEEIRMDEVRIKTIKKESFCAMNILSVIISNATINEVETGAFSDRTLINGLEFSDVTLKMIRYGAFRAGVNDLAIRFSRLADIETGGIDMTVASVVFNNNEFYDLRHSSIVFHQWNRIAIDHNVFQHIESNAINAIYDVAKAASLGFSFSDNFIHEVDTNSLVFIGISQGVNDAKVGSNYFKQKCNCNIESWVRERVGDNASVSWIMDTSHCVVDKFLFDCFTLPAIENLREGYLGMRNYTQTVCSTNPLRCDKDPTDKQPRVAPPSVGPHRYPKRKGYFDVEMSDPEQMEREKRIIVIVCVVATLSLIIVMITSGILYIRRRGACPKLSTTPLNPNSWFEPTVGMTDATSVSRLSIHEYTGLQPESRVLDIEEQEAEGKLEGAAKSSGYSYHENKATQTLPEELTEEYLIELKEKLNDPEKYTHARDMIEHLYDLIKVEESNNNNERRLEDGEPYEDIRNKTKRPKSIYRQTSVTVGTKVPSLEKLFPSTIPTSSRPELTDYAQPKDHQIIDQNHLYTELPGDETVPSTSRLSEPVLATLAGRAPQPLPLDVINDHSTESNGSLIYGIEADENRSLNSSQDSTTSLKMKDRRSMSFLKALGDTFIGPKKVNGRRPNSLLSEYADPMDVTSHLYSELPEQKHNVLTMTSTKMANRPLPTKPDLHEIEPMALRS